MNGKYCIDEDDSFPFQSINQSILVFMIGYYWCCWCWWYAL